MKVVIGGDRDFMCNSHYLIWQLRIFSLIGAGYI
jgi:hypothetical protein